VKTKTELSLASALLALLATVTVVKILMSVLILKKVLVFTGKTVLPTQLASTTDLDTTALASRDSPETDSTALILTNAPHQSLLAPPTFHRATTPSEVTFVLAQVVWSTQATHVSSHLPSW
jgi:hypothetical protein